MTFSIFSKPQSSVAFSLFSPIMADEYSDKTIVNRPTFKAIYREFDIVLFCFVLFFYFALWLAQKTWIKYGFFTSRTEKESQLCL